MPVTFLDAIGLGGVVLMLVAYGLAIARRLDPVRPPALLLNLVGSVGVLVSLTGAFNLSAAVIESAWALIAAGGLVRWALGRRGAAPDLPPRGGGGSRRLTEGEDATSTVGSPPPPSPSAPPPPGGGGSVRI